MRQLAFLTALSAALLCGSLTAPFGASAQTPAPFFEALYDVPVMEGLEELKDQAMLFDKPDGRIASVVAVSERRSPQDIIAFYNQTLPELGWKKNALNQYVRGKDQLALSVTRRGSLTIAHFTLTPAVQARPGR